MAISALTGQMWKSMVLGGNVSLTEHISEVNDLNVFPIPDGDTGDNMSLTIHSGAVVDTGDDDVSTVSSAISDGMLLGARGNSGVILSQFFSGLSDGFAGVQTADLDAVKHSFRCGVEKAYQSVLVPTEGTILTVIREATEYACKSDSIEQFFLDFIDEAKRSLERTPELLDVLKEAGVVDSGGAGLIYIIEGMYNALTGKEINFDQIEPVGKSDQKSFDPNLFTSDSELEFGYCTEFLLRLQNRKTDVENFDIETVTKYLETVGNSIVAIKTGSIVKVHVHTMTPYKVLEFGQKYGEFLTVKIENMMLQHSEVEAKKSEEETPRERVPFAVVTVASGQGVHDTFKDFGADEVIEGGQTMNPSSEDFINAFKRVNADTVFVLPNNKNIILAAKQAGDLFEGSDVRVIPTRTVGDGYAVLSMLDMTSGDADMIESNMNDCINGVLTAEISQSNRDATIGGISIKKGEYIGILEGTIVACEADAVKAACRTFELMDLEMHDPIIIIKGKNAADEQAVKISAFVESQNPFADVNVTDGGQDIYDFILVAE